MDDRHTHKHHPAPKSAATGGGKRRKKFKDEQLVLVIP